MTSNRHRQAAAAAAAAALSSLALLTGCGGGHPRADARAVSAHSPVRTPNSGRSATGVSSADRSWIGEVHQAALAEQEAGALAAQKASSGAVQSVGAMLASEHTAFDDKVIGAASTLHVALPDYLTLSDAEASDRMGTEMGSVYDHDFTATMMTAHQHLISDTQNEISHGSSPEVTGLARQALPMLRQHLAALQAVAAAP